MWIALGFAANQIIRLGSSLFLTRMLAPDLYGLLAIGSVVVSGVVLLSDVGLVQSIIQSDRGDDKRFINTVWTMKVARGLGLALLLALIALGLHLASVHAPGLLPKTYGDPRLPLVMAVLALVPLVEAFESTNVALCRRAIRIGPVVRNEVVSQLLTTLIICALAWWRPAVWLLPFSWVLLGVIRAVLSYLLPGPGNWLAWDRAVVSQVWRFSKWILVSSALTFAYREGDKLVLGALISPAQLGTVGIAMMLIGAVQQVIINLSAHVGMPALAEVARERPQDLRAAYMKCRAPLDLVCLAAAGLLFTGAAPLIGLLFDHRYQDAAQALSILSLSFIALRYSIFDEYLVATGETRQLFKRGLIRALSIYALVPLGYHLSGFPGAMMGSVAAQFLGVGMTISLMIKRHLFDPRYEIKTLAYFGIAAAAGAILTRLLQ